MTAVVLLILAAPPSYAAAWGVVSGDGKSVYLRNDKGLEALDGATGKPLWSADGVRPVAEAGGVLVAYGQGKGGMRLVGLDAKTGKEKWGQHFALSDWVVVGDAPGRSFTVRAASDGDRLVVEYAARSWYWGGARPTPEIEKAARRSEGAVVKLDPSTGKVDKGAKATIPAAGPHRNGEVEFRVEPGAKVVLHRKKGGKELPAVTLSEKPARVAVALDGKVVLVQGDGVKRAPVRAFDSATGELVGRCEASGGLEALDAVGGRVFAFGAEPGRDMPFGKFPRTLEVIDLKTGKAVWSRKGESLNVMPPPP